MGDGTFRLTVWPFFAGLRSHCERAGLLAGAWKLDFLATGRADCLAAGFLAAVGLGAAFLTTAFLPAGLTAVFLEASALAAGFAAGLLAPKSIATFALGGACETDDSAVVCVLYIHRAG